MILIRIKERGPYSWFLGTEQAATALTSDEYYRYKYNENIDNSTEEFNNMMWGLMIPKSSFDSYPREGISIMDAYPQFMNWAKSGGKMFWIGIL